jgi:hypothetical protein
MVEGITKLIRIGKFMKRRKNSPPHRTVVVSERRMSPHLLFPAVMELSEVFVETFTNNKDTIGFLVNYILL